MPLGGSEGVRFILHRTTRDGAYPRPARKLLVVVPASTRGTQRYGVGKVRDEKARPAPTEKGDGEVQRLHLE